MILLKIIGVLFVVIIIYGIYVSVTDKSDEKLKELGVISGIPNCVYLGGLPDVVGGTKLDIIGTLDSLEMYFGEKGKKTRKSFQYSDVIGVEIQSEHELQRNISAGKIFMFGLLGLASNKTTTVVRNYLLINIKEDDKIRNIVIQTKDDLVQTSYDNLIKCIGENKTKENDMILNKND